MLRHFPDIPQELKKSYQNVSKAMSEKRSKGLAGQLMDSVTGGIVSVGTEALWRLPVNVLVVPVARTVNDAVRGTVKGALNLTGRAIASIPWIPAPRNTSQPHTPELASLYDPLSSPPPGPGSTGSRSGTSA